MGQPSSLQNVDERGYVFVTEAADCQVKATKVPTTMTASALPATPLAGRRRMYVKNNSGTTDVYIGGADVTTTNGYQLADGQEVVLEVTDDLIVYVISATAGRDVRVLELA
jgi:hypothetical protein